MLRVQEQSPQVVQPQQSRVIQLSVVRCEHALLDVLKHASNLRVQTCIL